MIWQNHKEARQYRYGPLVNYDILNQLFHANTATGNFALASTEEAHPQGVTRPPVAGNGSDALVDEEDLESDVIDADLTQEDTPVAESSSMAAARRRVESPVPAPEPKRRRTTQGDRIADAITALINESERQRVFEETTATAPSPITNVERAIMLVQESRWLSVDGLFTL